MSKSIYSLSLSARLTLDMHSLNNEGGEGNQIQTRMVNIVDANGRLQNVNAISGDMFKHIVAEHLHKVAVANNLPLCTSCRTFNANRISADETFMASIDGLSDAESLDKMIQTCAVDDMLGNLITAGSRSLPRKSVFECGWVIGLPDKTKSDSYFHVKYASERSDAKRTADSAEGTRKANLGQAIFHRPANSGIYALIASIEAARIGFNDITQKYAIDEAERERRYRALLEAVTYALIEPSGAMRNTQAPHIVNVTGVVTTSEGVIPAPTLSPLKEGYDAELVALCITLNGIRKDALSAESFTSLNGYAQQMSALIGDSAPFALNYAA